jgi:hypothetical protein
VILSWAIFGIETWQAFVASLPLTQHVILEQGSTGWQKIQSVFSWARMWGADVQAAYACQSVVAIVAVLAAIWVWVGKAPLAVRAGAMVAAMLLSTPYLLDYDLAVLAVPVAMLMRLGVEKGFRPFELCGFCRWRRDGWACMGSC